MPCTNKSVVYLPLHGGSSASIVLSNFLAYPVHEAYDVLHIFVSGSVSIVWEGEGHAAAQAAEEHIPSRCTQVAGHVLCHRVRHPSTRALWKVGVRALHLWWIALSTYLYAVHA